MSRVAAHPEILDPHDVARAIHAELGSRATPEIVLLLLAHSAHETASWRGLKKRGVRGLNLAGIKAGPTWSGDFYHASTTETVDSATANRWVRDAPPRDDGTPGPSAVIVGERDGQAVVRVHSPHPVSRFRAYRDLQSAVRDWLDVIRKRWPQAFNARTVEAYAAALHPAGGYRYSGDLPGGVKYARALAAHLDTLRPVVAATFGAAMPDAKPQHLVILALCDPSLRQRYVDALPDGVEFVLVNSRHKGMSSAYRALAADVSYHVDKLAEYARASRPASEYQTITLAHFSAGYGLVEELLKRPEQAAKIHGVVSLDSIHSGFDPDGSASDTAMGPWVQRAIQAREGRGVFWIGHTDVPTYQAFASTTQTAAEIRRLSGMQDPTPRAIGGDDWALVGDQVGGLLIASIDQATDHKREHSLALVGWGPSFLAAAVRDLLAQPRPSVTALAVPPARRLGLRALDIAVQEYARGIREVPGPQANPSIVAYFAGCMRGGKNIGAALRSDEIPWCAAAASYTTHRALAPGETPPHGYRAAVRELWEDALAAGTAVAADKLRRGDVELRIGDLVVLTRGGPAFGSGAHAFAKTRGLGHVGTIDLVGDSAGTFRSLDGNVNDTWSRVARDLSDRSLVGVIRRGDDPPRVPESAELEALEDLSVAPLTHIAGATVAEARRLVSGWF